MLLYEISLAECITETLVIPLLIYSYSLYTASLLKKCLIGESENYNKTKEVPRFHTMVLPTENTSRFVLLFIFGFPYFHIQQVFLPET